MLLIIIFFIRIHPTYSQDGVALKINEAIVSNDELDFLINEQVAAYKKKVGALPPPDSIRLWKRNFVDRMLLIADAYDRSVVKGDVDIAVLVMSKYMVSLPTSTFYLSKFGKSVSEEEVHEAYKKRDIKYEVEYFQFDDASKLKNLISVAGTNPFEDPSLKSSIKRITLIWPVSKFAYERIWEMKEGEVSGPVISKDCNYLLKVGQITKNEQQTFDLEKNKIEKMLKMHYQILTSHEYYENLTRRIKFDSLQINQMWIDYKSGLLKQKHQFSVGNTRLLTYSLNKSEFKVDISNFLDYYNYLPIKRQLTKVEHLYDFLSSIVVTEELYREAETLGFTKDNDFVFRRNRFRNKLILDEYYRKMMKLKFNLEDNKSIDMKNQLQNQLILEAKKKFKPVINFEIDE